jgi:hypothetical protein
MAKTRENSPYKKLRTQKERAKQHISQCHNRLEIGAKPK